MSDIVDLDCEYLVATTSMMTRDESSVFILGDDEKFEVFEQLRTKQVEKVWGDGSIERVDLADRSKYVYYSPPLLSKDERAQLIENHARQQEEGTHDFKPVVKLFNPTGSGTWLLSELEPANNVAFGLCCLGMGTPELGSVSLTELRRYVGAAGLRIERDRHFKARLTLSAYADKAMAAGHIVV